MMALVRGCGQAYALQTVAPVTYRCGTRRVCQARSSGSERDTRARPHAVAPMHCVPEDSRRRSTCTERTHAPRARADGTQTPSSTIADDGQSGAVNDEVQAGARAGAPKREGEMLTASRARGVIGCREIDAQHPEDRGHEALGLTQRSVENETERQGGFDGEIGILEVPAPPADASRCPRGDRVGREPEGDVASPHEGSVVLGPGPDAILCRVRRMHARLHSEIMTRRRSRWSTCRPLLAHRAESAHQRLTRREPVGQVDERMREAPELPHRLLGSVWGACAIRC